jgi:hypothetical protein
VPTTAHVPRSHKESLVWKPGCAVDIVPLTAPVNSRCSGVAPVADPDGAAVLGIVVVPARRFAGRVGITR